MAIKDNCLICHSEYKDDIDRMICANANSKYIQTWCQNRNFKISYKEIRIHRDNHINDLEKITVQKLEIDPIYLKIEDALDKLDINNDELSKYLSANNLKIARSEELALVPLMLYLINSRLEIIEALNKEFNQASNKSLTDKIRDLKAEKIKAQVRYQEAVANLRQVKLKQLNGELINCKDLEEKWAYATVGFKAKLESIPNKLALQLSSINDQTEIERILKDVIDESLDELKI